ncbi:hypothetical protein Tco_1159371, partial [Tanacetum coccineum]
NYIKWDKKHGINDANNVTLFDVIGPYYDLDHNVYPTFLHSTREEMDLFAFIRYADPTKVRIGKRPGRLNEEDHSEESDHAGQDKTTTILRDKEVQAAATD